MPANHVNAQTAKSCKKIAKRLPKNFFPANSAIPEKSERCIPESARICESPAFLNPVHNSESAYSFMPEINAKSSPPASPHVYSIRRNCILHEARNFLTSDKKSIPQSSCFAFFTKNAEPSFANAPLSLSFAPASQIR